MFAYLTSFGYSIARLIPSGEIEFPVWDDELENFLLSNYIAIKAL